MNMTAVEKGLNILRNGYNHQIILYGPPGTSKTHSAKIIAANLIGNCNNITTEKDADKTLKENKNRFRLVQFHPSYNYDDFVRGITMRVDKATKTPSYKVEDKVFGEFTWLASIRSESMTEIKDAKENLDKKKEEIKRITGTDKEEKDKEIDEAKKNLDKTIENTIKKAKEDFPNEKYVMIIDEINRAPLASVLGELIYALEYRGKRIETLYEEEFQGCGITVPDNLYIIGTMNTADRSIGTIDYAVRRRFAFIHMPSEGKDIINSWKYIGEIASYIYEKLKEILFSETIVESDVEVSDIEIGHTYFLGNKDKYPDEKKELGYFKYRLEYQVKPIYEEYIKDGLIRRSEGKIVAHKGIQVINEIIQLIDNELIGNGTLDQKKFMNDLDSIINNINKS